MRTIFLENKPSTIYVCALTAVAPKQSLGAGILVQAISEGRASRTQLQGGSGQERREELSAHPVNRWHQRFSAALRRRRELCA